jgi:hypothetical protein
MKMQNVEISVYYLADEKTKERGEALIATSFQNTKLEGTPETDDEYGTGIWCQGNACQFNFIDFPEPDEQQSNGTNTVSAYHIDGATVFIESCGNDAVHIYPANTSILTMLGDWDTGDLDFSEFLAQWGYDATPNEAPEGAKDVRIWIAHNYYQGTLGAPVDGYVVAEGSYSDSAVFATKDDAQAWIDEKEDGIYCTSHGEAGRPAYTICE